MMEGLAGILLSLGGPVLARALARRFGKGTGEFVQDALDALGQAFGVEPTEAAVTTAVQKSAAENPAEAQAKVTVAEADMAKVYLAEAELQRAGNDQQRMTNELLLAEAKEPGWRSAWLYIWQYFIMALFAWTILIVPPLNAALRLFATHTSTDLITGQLLTEAPQIWAPDLGMLMQLAVLYLGLHMGGHTVLEIVRNGLGGLLGKGKDAKAD